MIGGFRLLIVMLTLCCGTHKRPETRRETEVGPRLGLRASEIAAIQLKHIDFKPVTVKVDGKQRHVFVISLLAAMTKGGKTTGEIEHVYAGSERLKKELTRSRFRLRRDPDAFVFARRTAAGFRASAACGGNCSVWRVSSSGETRA